MDTQTPRRGWLSIWRWWIVTAVLLVIAGLAAGSRWQPEIRQWAVAHLSKLSQEKHDEHKHAAGAHDDDGDADGDHDHDAKGAKDDHDHEAEGAKDEHGEHAHEETAPGHKHDGAKSAHKHDEAAAVKLSQAAQENVGLQLAKVELRSFERTISIPAIIVERAGRSNIQVAAPMTGVITRVCLIQGETATPGQPLFELRLTHEEVVEAQTEFLRTTEELDVVGREISRLEKLAVDGAIAGKTLLERKYEQQKLQAVLRSQRQRLLLHGLSGQQVDAILANRTLLGELAIPVPEQAEASPGASAERLLQVQEIRVEKGQHVRAGDTLCVLADHGELYIQGKAFEQDAAALEQAACEDWRLTAVIDATGRKRLTVPGLKILYVANKVEPESRAFFFYVQLPNKLLSSRQTSDGHRFSSWHFKPGQRAELLVPVERWANRIVLPIAAIVQDGAESYVFEQNEGHFDRRTVRVEYRDQFSAVIASDGVLTPGKTVIVSGAYQVHLAMKNKAGGAPDPHAGHNH